jgi:hypothetical protein
MSNRPKQPEECRGCYASEDNMLALACTLLPNMNGEQCPCVDCLVKVICNLEDDGCQIHYEFAKHQYD